MYGGSDAQVDYRLGLVQHGCDSDRQFAYHADAAARPVRWIGRGLEAFGVGRAIGRVDAAARPAEAGGLAPGEVWGADRVAESRAALWEPREVRDPVSGEPVLDADGTPRIELVQRRERVGIAGYDIGITLPK